MKNKLKKFYNSQIKNELSNLKFNPPFIVIWFFEMFLCWLLIEKLMTISGQLASTDQEILVFLGFYSLLYFIIKMIQYCAKLAFLEPLPFSYSFVSYFLQFRITLDRLADSKKVADSTLTDSILVVTLMLVVINIIDKGFDSYKRFKEAKEHS